VAALLTAEDSKPEYSITLDWLAFTFKEDTHEAANWISLYASNRASMAIAPNNGYKQAYRAENGIVVQWNTDREEMGYHVVIAGSAIRYILSNYELDQKALIQTVIDAGGSITRLDIAKDVQGVNISIDEIYKALERGEHSGTARTFSQIHSLNGGNTIYVGSRQSEKFIRIYDKGAQQGAKQELWYRYELETKGMVARAVATLLCSNSNWNAAFTTIAIAMVNIPANRDYQAFFADKSAPIGIPKLEKKSDREKWIESQVTPAVAKHAIEFPDSIAVARLVALLALIKQQGNTP
jgi:phage replication initiation protein